LKINGIVGKFTGPLVQAAISIDDLKINNVLIWLLVDTGATYTQLSQRDWSTKLHIDPVEFRQLENEPTLTAGGIMPSWELPMKTRLVFRTSGSSLHIEELPSIRIIRYDDFPAVERKKLEAVPSILGRDVILKFKTTLTNKRIEMEKRLLP